MRQGYTEPRPFQHACNSTDVSCPQCSHHPVRQRGSRPSLGVSLSNGRFDCHWGMSVLTEFDGRRTFWLLRILSTPNDACFDPNINLGLSGTIPSALSPTLKTMCVLCPRVVCVSHLFSDTTTDTGGWGQPARVLCDHTASSSTATISPGPFPPRWQLYPS